MSFPVMNRLKARQAQEASISEAHRRSDPLIQ